MSRIVNFGVIVEPFKAEVHQQEMRDILPNEVLVKLEACNICTGDYTQYIGLRNHQGFPHAGGHEWVGKIVEIGADVISLYKVGDRVSALSGAPCGQCGDCMTGNFIECKYNVQYIVGPDGYYGDKLFATYAIMKVQNLVKVSDKLPAAHAAMIEPLSTCVQAAKQGRIKPLDDVVIIGAGTMGILNAQVAKCYGAKVYITDMSEKKLERARSMGFAEVINILETDPVEEIKRRTDNKGADAVFICVGNDKAYEQGYAMLRQFRGRMIFFPAGFPKPSFCIPPNDIHYRMIEEIGTYGSTVQDYYDAAAFMGKGLLDVGYSMEGVSFPLSRFDEALKFAAEKDRYRVSVSLDEE